MDINFEKLELIKMVIDINNPLVLKEMRQIFEESEKNKKSDPNKIKKDIK